MKKRTKIILSVFLALLFLLGIGSYAYLSDYYHADETALAVMASQTGQVQIEQNGNVTWFAPQEPVAGLIFYPGRKGASLCSGSDAR